MNIIANDCFYQANQLLLQDLRDQHCHSGSRSRIQDLLKNAYISANTAQIGMIHASYESYYQVQQLEVTCRQIQQAILDPDLDQQDFTNLLISP